MSNHNKKILWGIALVLLAAAGVFAYWWFFMRGAPAPSAPVGGGTFPETTTTTGTGKNGVAGGTETGGALGAGEEPRLRQLTEGPVAGAVIFSRDGNILIRYAERGTGHLFEMGAAEATARRISNQTIPEIGEALWKPDGSGVIVRYNKTTTGASYIESFYANVSADATEGQPLKASFLPRNIRTLAFSPTGNTLFYLSENTNGGSGVLASPDGSRKTTLIDLPLKDMSASWMVNDSVFLMTRVAAGIDGSLFSVGTQSGAVDAVENGAGLTALPSRSGSFVLSGTSDKGSTGLSIFNRATGETVPLGLSTIADKCVWGKKEKTKAYCAVPNEAPAGAFPDGWYQGTIQTDDSIWKISAEDGRADLVAGLASEARVPLDAFNFDISPDDQYLLFQNKNDLTLWLLKL